MDESQALEADMQSAEVMKPGDGPLYVPAGFAETDAVRLAAPCYFACNADNMHVTDDGICRDRSLCRPERSAVSIAACRVCQQSAEWHQPVHEAG